MGEQWRHLEAELGVGGAWVGRSCQSEMGGPSSFRTLRGPGQGRKAGRGYSVSGTEFEGGSGRAQG